MIDRELDDAFDGLFVGDDPPASAEEALHRLPAELRARVAGDDAALRTLTELVWVSQAIRAAAPRPSPGFAERAAAAAFRPARARRVQDWRMAAWGTAVVAVVVFGIGVAYRRPQPEPGPELVSKEPLQDMAEPLTIALLDRVKDLVPSLPVEPAAFASLGGARLASLASEQKTSSLAHAIKAPAGNLAAVGKTLGKEVTPIRDSVRDAFAFLGEFPMPEKKSL